jgi:alpha-tubulin suppressor-like RCC1 family protein
VIKETSKEQNIPKIIKDLNHTSITSVSCGARHTLFLSKNKEVYACGDGEHGQLGQGFTRKEKTPKLISFGTVISEKRGIT